MILPVVAQKVLLPEPDILPRSYPPGTARALENSQDPSTDEVEATGKLAGTPSTVTFVLSVV